MIHPQLKQDCHLLGRFPVSTLLLHRNASLPWFILVPATELEDLLDLPERLLNEVTGECQQVSKFLKRELGYQKINFAALGNVVPQLHLHVIGRAPDDACWPQPVWGNLHAQSTYETAVVSDWQARLVAGYGLCVTE